MVMFNVEVVLLRHYSIWMRHDRIRKDFFEFDMVDLSKITKTKQTIFMLKRIVVSLSSHVLYFSLSFS